MIGRRALVVTDSYGVLEVFGPYDAGTDELSFDLTALEAWAVDSGDESVRVFGPMPLRDPDDLQQWIEDPESFYGVGEEL